VLSVHWSDQALYNEKLTITESAGAPARVEAGSNKSTVALRGDEKGTECLGV
jgi:hypothetical protein